MNPLLVDAHVHFYPCFDHEAFFEGAIANFRRAAADLNLPPAQAHGCLLMTEASGDHYFRRWWEACTQPSGGRWHFQRTGEDRSLLARGDRGESLVIVAGRQIATSDGLEVLALCHDGEFPDGLTTGEALATVREAGALAVLPWGFGKWSFRRGNLVAELLDSSGHPDVFLGDNGNRLGLAPQPRLFRRGKERGVLLLPGSDPLPFAESETRAGSYGFSLRADVDLRRPAEYLQGTLRETRQQPAIFGQLETPGRFLRSQLAMQVRKRGIRRA
jgi:hypothetical protein